jgi:hypothetical protein
MSDNSSADSPPRLVPGRFHRRVRVTGDGLQSSADLEDDQHRFGASIIHDGVTIQSVSGRAIRTPWTTCPLAVAELRALAGTPLLMSPYAVLRQIVLAQHCTHLIDMAALAVAAAARDIRHRQYDAVLALADEDGADWRIGTLERDGSLCSRWVFRDGIIREPAAYAGLEIRRAAKWIAKHTDDADEIESVFVMQRAMLVAGGRRYNLDDIPLATSQSWLVGACFTYQPPHIEDARRRFGSTRDFTDSDQLLTDLPTTRSPG